MDVTNLTGRRIGNLLVLGYVGGSRWVSFCSHCKSAHVVHARDLKRRPFLHCYSASRIDGHSPIFVERTPTRCCTKDGCEVKHYARGFCKLHYLQSGLYQRPPRAKKDYVPRIKPSPAERFNKFFQIVPGECWVWTGEKSRGYGRFTVNNKNIAAHRYAFFLHNGFWPEPCCLHSCDNPPCVNPDHLREGTRKDNAHDAINRNRKPTPSRKLSADDVRTARHLRATGVTVRELTERFNVTRKTISAAVNGRAWKWVS